MFLFFIKIFFELQEKMFNTNQNPVEMKELKCLDENLKKLCFKKLYLLEENFPLIV
jgi:hypothetical protein